ncbi:hypothetical protein DENSPDRAFT_836622 [Dentipellis sp. KUC8613]|nr:hypothetical protein DENSPDRAFT_836622 [Dentipellis sp. KUC8613]
MEHDPHVYKDEHKKGLAHLNYDVLLAICHYLAGDDVAHLLSTCHALHPHYRHDTTWRQLCQPYGLKDISSSEVWNSFYDAYTQVLHRYGALVGVWASDHPYRGNVLEFRLDVKSGCLIGEIWYFGNEAFHPLLNMQVPRLPQYRTVFRIGFDDDSGQTYIAPKVYPSQNWADDTSHEIFVPSLHLLAETYEEVVLYHPSFPKSPLPQFPAPGSRWYDHERGLPPMDVEPSPNSSLVMTAPPSSLPPHGAVSMAPGRTLKPAALCIVPPSLLDPEHMYEPRFLLTDFRHVRADGSPMRDYTARTCTGFYPRYYPLRMPVYEGLDPADEDWDPSSLEGLWLGAYGPHGTEVLSVEYDPLDQEVRAWKITGDINVPRGAQTWKFGLDAVLDRQETKELSWLKKPDSRVFSGTGTVSDVGFRPDQRGNMNLTVAVTGKDQISIHWVGMGADIPQYRRYRRDVPSEQLHDSVDGIRIPTLWSL